MMHDARGLEVSLTNSDLLDQPRVCIHRPDITDGSVGAIVWRSASSIATGNGGEVMTLQHLRLMHVVQRGYPKGCARNDSTCNGFELDIICDHTCVQKARQTRSSQVWNT
ncbi:hypothetical protein BS17DRAFT_789973 [Gyrodon lividus]|nr:hypothetical protein BS17DRAFT_789948 [Gyrodon lividus]KAF9219195.1 hypothetical protein BS17DRAFT_789973 [Gyrodon lividus]